MFNLPISEGRASEADMDSQAVAYTEVEVERNHYGFYFGVTQDTH